MKPLSEVAPGLLVIQIQIRADDNGLLLHNCKVYALLKKLKHSLQRQKLQTYLATK